jgi:hypothetical protein
MATTTSCDDKEVVVDFGKHGVAPMASYAFFTSGFPLTIKMAASEATTRKIMRYYVGVLLRLLTKKTLDSCTNARDEDRTSVVIVVCVIIGKRAVLPVECLAQSSYTLYIQI